MSDSTTCRYISSHSSRKACPPGSKLACRENPASISKLSMIRCSKNCVSLQRRDLNSPGKRILFHPQPFQKGYINETTAPGYVGHCDIILLRLHIGKDSDAANRSATNEKGNG